jgi:RNA-dependent RNA polymerase
MAGKTIQVSGFSLCSNAELAKKCLEDITCFGSVYALKFRYPKNMTSRSKAYAVVQFQTERHAKEIFKKAKRGLLANKGYKLKVRYMERDIVPKPRTFAFEIYDAKLHLGCLVSTRCLNAFWTVPSVQVSFGFNLRKIYFNLSWSCSCYKLELSYESIWEIQLHRSLNQMSQFLLIQVSL